MEIIIKAKMKEPEFDIISKALWTSLNTTSKCLSSNEASLKTSRIYPPKFVAEESFVDPHARSSWYKQGLFISSFKFYEYIQKLKKLATFFMIKSAVK